MLAHFACNDQLNGWYCQNSDCMPEWTLSGYQEQFRAASDTMNEVYQTGSNMLNGYVEEKEEGGGGSAKGRGEEEEEPRPIQ